jgi:hypothetical protein
MFSQPGLARPVAWATPHDLDRLRASHARGQPGKPLVPASVASPRLGDELFARLLAYGTPHETHRGDVLFRPGDEDVDLIVVDRGSVEVVRTETADVPAATVAAVDAGGLPALARCCNWSGFLWYDRFGTGPGVCLTLLPAPDRCRVLRAAGRVKGRAAPALRHRRCP